MVTAFTTHPAVDVATPVDARTAAVERHLKVWAAYADDRLMAQHPNRPVWGDRRRERFLVKLALAAPELTAGQLVAVVETFDRLVSRATVPAYGRMPELVIPGRVSQLVRDLDVGDVLGVR
jgi:hypothetical protein